MRLSHITAGGQIRRFHTVATIGHQTVAEHSWGVAMILIAILSDPSPNLLKAALYHDMAEQATGDVPAPVKWWNPALADELSKAEKKWESDNGFAVELTDYEKMILKTADMLELLRFCVEQRKLGNRNMESSFINGSSFLRTLLADTYREGRLGVPGSAVDMLDELTNDWLEMTQPKGNDHG